MEIKNYLDDLKNEYEKTDATWHLKMSGWSDLEKRIGLIEPKYKTFWRKSYAFSFAIIVIFAIGLFASYKTVLASVPGDILYPVKILSEKITQKITGNNQVAIDHRAQEIIDLSKKQSINSNELEKVVSEYKSNVEEAQKKFQDSGRQDINLQNDLQKQHLEFDQVAHDNPGIGNDIKAAQEISDTHHHKND